MTEQALVPAPDATEQAAQWLARRILGPWTEIDQAELDQWLAETLANEVAFVRMEAGWERTERLSALRDPGFGSPRASAPARPRYWGMRAAAMLFLISATGIGWALLPVTSKPESFSTPVGGHKTIMLTDGTQIELNTNTLIRTEFHSSRRQVALIKGEAYFQVRHDANRPFVVLAAGHRVIDLGTKFLVRNDAGQLRVSLIEGKAELRSASQNIQQHSVVLTPGDVAVASASSLNVARMPNKELHDELGWRRGVIVFSHTTLARAAAEFNRYNKTKIVIADQDARDRVIGATLPAHDVEAFADVAREIFGLRIQKREGEIVITH